MKASQADSSLLQAAVLGILSVGLFAISRVSYPLFHALVEMLGIAVAVGIFFFTIHAREHLENAALRLLGIAFLFIAVVSMLHTLAYKGMGVFLGYDANLPTQLWIVSRLMSAGSFLLAPLLLGRRFSLNLVASVFTLLTAVLLWIVFSGKFPDCYVEGQGLTRFKIWAESATMLLLAVAGLLFYQRRNHFAPQVISLLLSSIALSALAGVAFSVYVGVYDLSNFLGHLVVLGSVLCLHQAVLVVGVATPYALLSRQLRQVEAQYSRIVETANEGIWSMDAEHSITYTNSAMAEMLGYTAEDLLGTTVETYFFPEDLAAHAQRMEKRHAGKDEIYERRFRRKDGSALWTQVSAKALKDDAGCFTGSFAMFTDITKRRLAVEALQKSERRYLATLTAVNDGIWDWDVPSGDAYFSPLYYGLLGYVDNEFPASYPTWRALVHPEDIDRVEHELRKGVESGVGFSVDLRMRTKDDGWKWVCTRGKSIESDADGNALRMVGTLSDITKRKLDEELRNQIERVIQHDLRSPVGSAIQIAKMLREETSLTEDQRLNLLGLFEQSAQNMLDTLTGSLDLYKIETGTYQLQPEALDCAALARTLIQTLSASQVGDISLEVLSGGLPVAADFRCMCLCQPHLLRTAMQNILVNALEASPPGTSVTVDLRSSDKDCCIEITNKGVVPVEIRDRFFDKYTTSGKFKGTGLGTYSAKMMITAMGGDISMSTSDVDNETVVTVRMPC